MNDWIPDDVVFLLVRVTIILGLGTFAFKLTRNCLPSLAIVIARGMLAAIWLGPIVVLSGWTLGVAMLPAPPSSAILAEIVDPDQENSPMLDQSEFVPIVDEIVAKDESEPSSDIAMVREPISNELEIEAAKPAVIAMPHAAPSGSLRWTAWQWIVVVWSIVSGWLFAVFIIKAVRTWRLIRASIAADESLQIAFNRVATRLAIVTPTVRLTFEVAGPCTAGWFRPVVLLPASWADRWSEQELEMILAHEFSHADSRDSTWDALALLSRCLWWFHPLAVQLVRHHRLACEHRCDATAAQFADDTRNYRARLARWALQLRGCQQRSGLAALAMADRPLLIQRLRWLKERGQVTNLSARQRLLTCLTCSVVFVVTCVAEPTRQLSAAPQPPTEVAAQDAEEETSKEEKAQDSDDNWTVQTQVLGRLSGVIVSGVEPLDVDWADIRKLAVTVVDENNRPHKNAKVILGGFSDQAGAEALMEIIGGVKTDQRGIAQVLIPSRTARVFLLASAPGYSRQQNEFNTTGKIEFRLQPGRTITVRATDTEGSLLPDACPIVDNSNFLGREFKMQPDGTHRSPVLGAKRRWMRVADATREDGVILFSELIDLNRDDLVGENGFINVVLKPGVRLEGRLDDSVARPVKQGFVELMISEGQIGPPKGDGIEWQEQAKIQPDGTFVFPSLPPGTHVMLFVLGEGYQSKDPSSEQIEAYAEKHGTPSGEEITRSIQRNDPLPWLFHLDGPTTNITVPCRQTAALDVRVVDPAGQPIADAEATMSPNLYFFGEMLIPGMERSTRLEIEPVARRKYRTPDPFMPANMAAFRQLVTDSFLRLKTDDNGIARFRNIPSLSESFEIQSPGYVMAAYPTSTPEAPGRYGLARNLRSGDVVTKTITMERDLPRTTRELTVIYEGGRPLEDVQVTITDISTAAEDTDWQQWSVRRFGEVSNEKTDKNGRVVLWYPQSLEGKPVQSLRLYLQGRPETDVYFYANLNVPAKADGSVIKFTPEDEPRVSGALRVATPAYVDLASDSDKNAAEVLRMLLLEPSLITLRQLLALNRFDAAEPLSLQGKRNRINFNDHPPVARISTEAGWRIVVLADVRPQGATWVEKPRGRFPPEAAFVFDGKGNLLHMLGGGRSASGDYESIMLTNLGTTGDHFLRTSAFESHSPYEYCSRWYRIGAGDQPSLTTYHDANSTSWSGGGGKSDPISEFGYTEYAFNGQDIDHKLPGRTSAGVRVPRWITWDGRRNKFFAEPTQEFDGRSLYQVVLDESAEFVPVGATAETIVATGGRRDYQNWHLWTITVQDGMDLVARLERRDADGNTIETIRDDDLQPGLHKFQLHVDTNEQETESTISMMLNAADVKDKTEYTIPPLEIDARPSVEGQAVYVASKPPLRLFDKQLVDQNQSLVWVIESR